MSGRLFFYSDQVSDSPENRRLDALLFKGLDVGRISIGYIPSTDDKQRKFFTNKADYYRQYGVENMMFFDLYSEFNERNIEELLRCDIIHLSAGNPIQFRNSIMARNMDTVLSSYFYSGGTLVGVSGGAVQLGQTVRLFQLFTGNLDEALDCNSSLNTLQLVDFEFLPHYNRWTDDFKQNVVRFAQETHSVVYAGNDGDGIIIEDDRVQFIGEIKTIS